MPTIWLDADAAPRAITEVLARAANKRRVELVLVANRWIDTGPSAFVRAVLVSSGADVADDHIAEHCQSGDLVITADIPLAARAVERGCTVLQPRGDLLTAENVKERLSFRDFGEELRSAGIDTGGPAPFTPKDKQRFANGLDRWFAQSSR